MNRQQLVCVFCVTAVVIGCGDSPYAMVRDMNTCYNELADAAAKIPDDESAEEVAGVIYRNYIEPIKGKFEAIKKRKDLWDKATLTKKERKEQVEATEPLWKEGSLARNRTTMYYGPGGKIAAIRAKLAQLEAARAGKPVLDLEKTFPNLSNCIKGLQALTGSQVGGGGGIGELFPKKQPGMPAGMPGMPQPGMPGGQPRNP